MRDVYRAERLPLEQDSIVIKDVCVYSAHMATADTTVVSRFGRVKGIVHQKKKVVSLFSPLCCSQAALLHTTQVETVMIDILFHCMKKSSLNIMLNMSFCVPQKNGCLMGF